MQWVISAYMLSLGSLFILGGRLGDILGRRPMLLIGIAIFGAAAALCAVAPNLGALVVFRVLAGVGAALIFPIGIAVVSNSFSEARRAKALGLTFAIANIGTAVGPFVGGGLSQGPGWRWIFWALVPVCAISFVLALAAVADSREPSASKRIDYRGAALLVAGIALFSFVVDRSGAWGWVSPRSLGLLLTAVALIVAFLWTETRVANPLVDRSRNRRHHHRLPRA
jgi:MFS family permease